MAEASLACTLPPSGLRTRLSQLSNLTDRFLLASRREDLTLYLRYAPQAEVEVRRMVEEEQRCCTFLTFALEVSETAIGLTIVALPAARDWVETLYERFLPRSTSVGSAC